MVIHPRENESPARPGGNVVDLLHYDTSYPRQPRCPKQAAGAEPRQCPGSAQPGRRIMRRCLGGIGRGSKEVPFWAGITNVQFQQADIFPATLCTNPSIHVLAFRPETVGEPIRRWAIITACSGPGGTRPSSEGDHGRLPAPRNTQRGSNAIHDRRAAAVRGWKRLIGRQIYSPDVHAGMKGAPCSPMVMGCNTDRPRGGFHQQDGFTE